MAIPGPATVSVMVPATASSVQILRTVAMAVAPGALDIDRLDDLALGVGETAVALLAVDGANRLELTIDRNGDGLDLFMKVDSPEPPGWPERWASSLSAAVVGAIADDLRTGAGADGTGVGFRLAPRS